MLVSGLMGSIVIGALLAGSIHLQRSFASQKDYSRGLTNQTLLVDYLALDLRRAKTVTATGFNVLTVQIPDFYTGNQNGAERREPTIALVTRAQSRMVEAFYGAAYTTCVQVRYYKTGTNIYRQEGTKTALAIADTVDFETDYPQIDDPDNPGFLIDDLKRVTLSIRFTPTVKRQGLADTDRQTYLFDTITLRNLGN
ncbi:MAG: hypothetical protein QOE70_6723 [Chthoniobacter sp.]|nr:hypothetical protein [Chthoniobacter sp.]